MPQLAIERSAGSEQGGDNATPDALQSYDDHHRVRRAAESVAGHGGHLDAADKRHDRAGDAGPSDGRSRRPGLEVVETRLGKLISIES